MPPVAPDNRAAGGGGSEIDPAVNARYWSKTSRLMLFMLAIWAIAGFGVHFFAPTLNGIQFLGFPLGFYMAAQGSLIIFVVVLFIFARLQNGIDEEFGVEED